MKKSMLSPNILVFSCFILFEYLIKSVTLESSILKIDEKFGKKVKSSPLHMILLTQKDYIQFLRWELPVPNIEEFTFCLWLRSDNFTRPHSIFSYSKNEKDRLIRAWISAKGRRVHLEIGGIKVFEETIIFKENRWYHICQSWENRLGRFALWLNGRIKVQGYSEKTVNHVVPEGGDIVLGQEYTDFDKGLEDGIEGSIFGFNLLLKSAFDDESPIISIDHTSSIQTSSFHGTHYLPRTIFKISKDYHEEEDSRLLSITDHRKQLVRLINTANRSSPLGQELVKLSYVRCELGKGSPHIGGSLMLISWSRTPVRIFGGAILKNARKNCGNF
ncbi:uncharacterized protein LOC118442182 [Vespa mandarinia]|uniref:uncharacterized protein LOC118442182 n=1 Tax=Vespa mandarinia TaxID=7446 RepID=UPI00160D2DCD|nr:uncharacterized protein LOC118442182 [Vespa mandarinia]